MKKLLAITCILLTSIQLHAQPLSQLEERDLLLRVNTHFKNVTSPSGRFEIHFALTGFHAVDPKDDNRNGIPDYIDETARTFDRLWELQVDQLGYRPPISDGDEYYDIYIQRLGGQSVYGWAYQDAGTLEITTSSYIVIDKNFTDNIYATRGLNGLHVTAAHEFFHAVQFAYYANANATWMEDIAYGQINDYYQYLPQFFGESRSTF
jgi:hypothetical protein